MVTIAVSQLSELVASQIVYSKESIPEKPSFCL